MRDRVSNVLGDLLALIPEIILFLVILAIGFLIASLLAKGTDALLNKLRVNRLFSRNVEKATSRRIGWNVVSILSKVVYWLVVLFTLYFAFGVFGETNPFFVLFAAIIAFLPKVIVAILLVVIAGAVAGIVRGLISGALSGINFGRVLANATGIIILAFGVLAALAQVGVAVAVLIPLYTAFLITVAGILIVGVGGALAVVLRPFLARALDNLQDQITDVVATTNPDEPTDPEPDMPVAVEPAPITAPRITRPRRPTQ